MDTCILEENSQRELPQSHVTITMHTEERGVQTYMYFPKVVKSFRTVAAQTDNNIAINIYILNSKKVHPEKMNILEIDHMEDHNYSICPSSKYK